MSGPRGKTRWLIAGGVLAAGAVAGACLFFFDPAVVRFYPFCPFHKLTGLYCPGCGTGRAVHQLVHGRILEAFDRNPLFVLSLPFLGYALARRAIAWWRGVPLSGPPVRAVWIWLILAVIVLFGVARNIPMAPFTFLAP